MSERFDVLVQGITQKEALSLLFAKSSSVARPSDRYFAATRLGLATCDQTLNALIRATYELSKDELFDRITRRKAIEALGRRKDVRAIPALFDVLKCTDSEAVINAISSLIRIGWTPDEHEEKWLFLLLDRGGTLSRSVIQAYARLGIKNQKSREKISNLCHHESVLVSGAARACLTRLYAEKSLMDPLVLQLTDLMASKRRSAVIDIGDSLDSSLLSSLVRAPVSLSLRAKSFFQILDGNPLNVKQTNQVLLKRLLLDNPLLLDLKSEWHCEVDAAEIEKNLSHPDEARQYGAAASLMAIDRDLCLEIVSRLHERLWSDYVTHYYLTCIIGLRQLSEKSDLVRSALSESTPQYAKSRIAAAWASVELQLDDQLQLLYELSNNAQWVPLRWSCQQAFAELIERQQTSSALNKLLGDVDFGLAEA